MSEPEEVSQPERNVEDSAGDERPEYWFAVMAKSGTHWVVLEQRRGNQRFYPPKEQVDDAG